MHKKTSLIRPLSPEDVKATAKLWHDGWHEAHDHLIPPYPPHERSLECFERRLLGTQDQARIAFDHDQPVALCITEQNEVAQLFVTKLQRGTHLGKSLLIDAEKRIKQNSFTRAWLTVVVGNAPARIFYERCGWAVVSTLDVDLSGIRKDSASLEMWRLEKDI